MKIYIFICGRNINVYGSGNMCAHEKWLNIVAKRSLFERMKAFFGLEGFFFSFQTIVYLCLLVATEFFLKKQQHEKRERYDSSV